MELDQLTERWEDLRMRLVDARRLLPTSVDGLYGRDSEFEAVVDGMRCAVRRASVNDDAMVVDFPPVVPTTTYDAIGYIESFPQLSGLVYSFGGDDRAHAELVARHADGEHFGDLVERASVTLTPACCYPVYPMCTGELPETGRTFEISGYCFRNEPSRDPMRMQAFRQMEHVRVGSPEQTAAWRTAWVGRARRFFDELQLDTVTDFATDAFFGRRGRLMSTSQREQELKTEFLVNVFGDEHRTACASINNHQEHFGELFAIASEGDLAHSSCIGFGLERCAVALFATHGTSVDGWPSSVRGALGLGR